MCVMHDLRNSGVLCLKKNLAVSVKRFKNSEMQKKSFETEIAQRDLGFNSFSRTSKCCQFHFFTTILSRPQNDGVFTSFSPCVHLFAQIITLLL